MKYKEQEAMIYLRSLGQELEQGVGVNCENCGFSNDPGARFCGGCARSLVREGEVIHPQFVTGNKGRPYCATHTSFDGRRLEEYDGEHLVRPLRAHSLSCKSCEHYIKDDCYFSAPSIDAITEDIFKRRRVCDLCVGWWVATPVVVLQKIYMEQVSGSKGYIACPLCDRYLKIGQNSLNRYESLLSVSLSLLLTPLIFLFQGIYFIEVFIVVVAWWVYALYTQLRLCVAYPQNRRNLKKYRLARDQGLNPKIILAVD